MRTLAKEGRLPPTLEEPPPAPAAAADAGGTEPAPSVLPPRSVKARSPFSRLTLHATDAGAALFRHKSPSKSPTRSLKSPPPKGKQQQPPPQAAQHADRSRQPKQQQQKQQPSSSSHHAEHSKGAHSSASSFARGLRFQLKRRNTSAFAGQLRPDPGPGRCCRVPHGSHRATSSVPEFNARRGALLVVL